MWLTLNTGHILVKINRISAWALLIFMIVFLVSGYAWVDHIIMPVQQAKYLHTQLDMYLVFFFLVHVLINTKFTLKTLANRRRSNRKCSSRCCGSDIIVDGIQRLHITLTE